VKSLFDEIGFAGAGLILILVGIAFAVSGIAWATFCIVLGISALAFAGAKGSKGNLRTTAGFVSLGCFIASIVILLTSLPV
jgi:hypothetical protein